MKKGYYSDLLAKAKAKIKLQPDGGYEEEDLIASLEDLISIDLPTEKRRLAKTIIDAQTKPGGTEPTGQLHLPGFEPYGYEPLRLIRDDNGRVIEQDKAPHNYKFAESERAAKHAHGALQWAHRKRKEAQLHAGWVIEQQKQGLNEDLTFGHCIRDSDLFELESKEPEEVAP